MFAIPRTSSLIALLVAIPLSAQAIASPGADPVSGKVAPTPDAVIAFYERKLEQHPGLFSGFAALGSAYLDKARETHDVTWLAKSRTATARSLEIQPNINALTTMAAICNFTHRFACGLEHATKAARINPDESSLLSLHVEAHLGLGQIDEADKLLDAAESANPARFDVLASRGRWFMEQERYDEAHASFTAATTEARKMGAHDLIIWAEANAAGTLIDSNRPQLARPHLETASKLKADGWPIKAVLQIHWAELDELDGHAERALAAYESILARQDDPELFRRAFLIARKLGHKERAESLLAAGERAAERISSAGEIFALESQALLYADAGIKLDSAEQLALLNLEHKKDRSAREALQYVRKQKGAENAS